MCVNMYVHVTMTGCSFRRNGNSFSITKLHIPLPLTVQKKKKIDVCSNCRGPWSKGMTFSFNLGICSFQRENEITVGDTDNGGVSPQYSVYQRMDSVRGNHGEIHIASVSWKVLGIPSFTGIESVQSIQVTSYTALDKLLPLHRPHL